MDLRICPAQRGAVTPDLSPPHLRRFACGESLPQAGWPPRRQLGAPQRRWRAVGSARRRCLRRAACLRRQRHPRRSSSRARCRHVPPPGPRSGQPTLRRPPCQRPVPSRGAPAPGKRRQRRLERACSAPHPSEWIYLPREAYCALKGRCCNSSASPPPAALAALSNVAAAALRQAPAPEDDTSQWGSPLEVALDRAVVIGEAPETIRQPMTSAGGSAGGCETGLPPSRTREPTSEGRPRGVRGDGVLSPRARRYLSGSFGSAAKTRTPCRRSAATLLKPPSLTAGLCGRSSSECGRQGGDGGGGGVPPLAATPLPAAASRAAPSTSRREA